jgi:hypothetical protein
LFLRNQFFPGALPKAENEARAYGARQILLRKSSCCFAGNLLDRRWISERSSLLSRHSSGALDGA